MRNLNKFEGTWCGKSVITTLTKNNDINIEHDVEIIFKIESVTTAPNTYTILFILKGNEYLFLGSVVNDVLFCTSGDKFIFEDNKLYHSYQSFQSDNNLTATNSNAVLFRLLH